MCVLVYVCVFVCVCVCVCSCVRAYVRVLVCVSASRYPGFGRLQVRFGSVENYVLEIPTIR